MGILRNTTVDGALSVTDKIVAGGVYLMAM